MLAIGALLLALTLTFGFAQGRGAGKGKGWGAQGKPCPYGLTQPNPNSGGWWTRVSPTDPKQKAFVEDVARLHTQIREKQFALRELEAAKASPETIKARQAEIDSLRAKLHDLQSSNRTLKQMMQNGRGRGRGQGICPYGNSPQGQMGQGRAMNQLKKGTDDLP